MNFRRLSPASIRSRRIWSGSSRASNARVDLPVAEPIARPLHAPQGRGPAHLELVVVHVADEGFAGGPARGDPLNVALVVIVGEQVEER